MNKHFLIILILAMTLGCSGETYKGIVISNNQVSLYETAKINSKKIDNLISGQVVSIIDSTKTTFEIGLEDVFCKEFPFIKVKTETGQTGWVSGQFIFKIIENPKRLKSKLILSKSDFSFNNRDFALYLGRNFGIASVDQEGLTGCEEFYPLIFFDKAKNQYFLVNNINNPNYKDKFCKLISDDSAEEKLVSIIDSVDKLTFKIKCAYIEGSGTYDMKIFLKDGKYYGESFNYKRLEE